MSQFDRKKKEKSTNIIRLNRLKRKKKCENEKVTLNVIPSVTVHVNITSFAFIGPFSPHFRSLYYQVPEGIKALGLH